MERAPGSSYWEGGICAAMALSRRTLEMTPENQERKTGRTGRTEVREVTGVKEAKEAFLPDTKISPPQKSAIVKNERHNKRCEKMMCSRMACRNNDL
jgi:hypothetical protein